MRKSLPFLAAVLLAAAPAVACPACKEAAGSDPKLTEGFARSIYLLMSAPYLLFAGLTLYVVRATRRKK